jgi:hypothetical protein
MAFDPCPHQITQIVLKAGAIIRQLKGLPEEKNITTLYNETAPLLGIPVRTMSSRDVNHLPSPAEMVNDKGAFTIPRKDCPNCNEKNTVILVSLCPSCKDSEGGKYHSAWTCQKCGVIMEKSEKFLTQVLNEMGIEIPNGSKKAFGIKTITDDGLK